MKLFKTEHYNFFFNEDSRAEKDIHQIAEVQEEVYAQITEILDVQFPMKINNPKCAFLREGLAMKADGVWWGIANIFWCKYFIETHQYLSVEKLFEDDYFYAYGDEITYPIAGAFVEWLIQTYSQETFIQLYKETKDYMTSLEELTGDSIDKIETRFVQYIQSTNFNDEILKKIEYERSR